VKQTTTIPSKYGPVDLEIISCDHCDRTVQIPHALGWCQLFQLTGPKTFGYLPDETHFCGVDHLKKYLEEHTNR
jgi:hypothetical protein